MVPPPAKLPLFPTTVVGSWPRPKWLIDAFEAFERGQLSRRILEAYMDDAVKLAIKDQELAGIDIVSDGEQRRYSFLAVIGEKLHGFRLIKITELAKGNKRATEIIRRMKLPKTVPQPIAVGKISRDPPIAVDEFEFARSHTSRPIKVPLPSPYLLTWNGWDFRRSRPAYPRAEDLADDLARVIREEIIALRDAGAHFVQLDDPAIQNPYTKKYTEFLGALLGQKPRALKDELHLAVDTINKTVKGIGGVKIGFHVCRGNWPAPEHILPRGDYGPLLPDLLELKVDQLVLEFATPRAGSIDVFKDYPTDKELGLGVIDVKNPAFEKPNQIVERVEKALRYFDAEKVYLNPDCGFASGRTWPVVARETAFKKLRAMVGAAKMLRRKLA